MTGVPGVEVVVFSGGGEPSAQYRDFSGTTTMIEEGRAEVAEVLDRYAEVQAAYIREALRRKNPDRPLDTNVEFFTAILLDALKIPRQAFTPIFAVARAAGWTAHAREQQRTGRLIRPSSAYIGPMPD